MRKKGKSKTKYFPRRTANSRTCAAYSPNIISTINQAEIAFNRQHTPLYTPLIVTVPKLGKLKIYFVWCYGKTEGGVLERC